MSAVHPHPHRHPPQGKTDSGCSEAGILRTHPLPHHGLHQTGAIDQQLSSSPETLRRCRCIRKDVREQMANDAREQSFSRLRKAPPKHEFLLS